MHTLTAIADHWGPIKTGIEHSLGLSSDAMHIHAGVALLLFFAWVTRRPLHDWRPWLMLLAVEVANEIIDMNQRAGSLERNWDASRHDLINTMFLPTLLVLYYAWRRWRQRSDPIGTPAETPAE